MILVLIYHDSNNKTNSIKRNIEIRENQACVCEITRKNTHEHYEQWASTFGILMFVFGNSFKKGTSSNFHQARFCILNDHNEI